MRTFPVVKILVLWSFISNRWCASLKKQVKLLIPNRKVFGTWVSMRRKNKEHVAENRTRKSWDLCSGFSILKMTEHKWERESERDWKNVTYSEIWEVSGEEIGADFCRRWHWPSSFGCRWWLESSWVQLTISFFTQKQSFQLKILEQNRSFRFTRYYNLG